MSVKSWYSTLIAMLFFSMIAGPVSAELTPEDKNALSKLGLSDNTIQGLITLYQDNTRKRPPALTIPELEKLVRAGFQDEHIRLFTTLDSLTGKKEFIPISPPQARELVSSGVSQETIRLMLVSEIARAAEQNTHTAGEKPELEQKVVIDNEGHRHIVYSTGETSGLGQEVVTDSEGHRHFIYRSLDSKPSIEEERQQAELRRARELLDKIQIHVIR
ncbi:MAG: hypothetical protein HQK55_04210 [Deltaproteobacteria bacterium]|nr:hypothetical protein [Deltaproteobacteria bacterium]